MALKDDINKKDKIIDKAEKRLLDGIKSSEKAIFNKIIDILRKLSQKEGRLQKETINNKFLNSITKKVLSVIRKSTLQKKIDEFLPNFEKIDKLNSDIYKGITGAEFTKKIRNEIGVYRRISIENIIPEEENALAILQQFCKWNTITGMPGAMKQLPEI